MSYLYAHNQLQDVFIAQDSIFQMQESYLSLLYKTG